MGPGRSFAEEAHERTGGRELLAAGGVEDWVVLHGGATAVAARLAAAVAAGGRIVDDSHASSCWTLSDRAGNRVCVCAWPGTPTADR